LRKLNGPKFTWPLLLFSGALPENLMARMGKIYIGKRLVIKSRKELLATIRPHFRKHLRADAGDTPESVDPEQICGIAQPLPDLSTTSGESC